MQTIEANGRTGGNGDATPSGRRTLRPGAAAEILHVDRATLRSYVADGLITRAFRTLGGHGRYWEDELLALAKRLADEEATAGVVVCPNCGHTCPAQAGRPAVAAGQPGGAAA
jgi:MerR-like DNA binding protein